LLQGIAHGDGEAGGRLPGIEAAAGGQHGAHGAQCLAQRLDQALGQRGWRQGAAAAYEQRIAKQRAQPPERVAHRRLGEIEPLCRPADAAFGDDRLEDDQQVEVDAGKINHIDGIS
jgi:hypothetical protein